MGRQSGLGSQNCGVPCIVDTFDGPRIYVVCPEPRLLLVAHHEMRTDADCAEPFSAEGTVLSAGGEFELVPRHEEKFSLENLGLKSVDSCIIQRSKVPHFISSHQRLQAGCTELPQGVVFHRELHVTACQPIAEVAPQVFLAARTFPVLPVPFRDIESVGCMEFLAAVAIPVTGQYLVCDCKEFAAVRVQGFLNGGWR